MSYSDGLLKKLSARCPKKDLEARYRELCVRANTLHAEPKDTPPDRARIKAEKDAIYEFCDLYSEYRQFFEFVSVWTGYEDLKRERKMLDYADLNKHVQELFRTYSAKKYLQRYRYVLVDEFQDTNKLQFDLLEHIASHRNITVVGDPNQSVYGFRGAYRESFNHFKEVFGVDDKKDVYRLEKSRRSPNTVLRIAHELIRNNYQDPSECLMVENYMGIEGGKVAVTELLNGAEEARYIADYVEKAVERGVPKRRYASSTGRTRRPA